MTDLEKEFLRVLDRHRGIHDAISVADLSIALRVSTRKVRQLKKSLVEEHGILIGSSCAGDEGGYYQPVTDDEVGQTVAQYTNRVRSLVQLIARTKRASIRTTMNELALEFDGDPRHVEAM